MNASFREGITIIMESKFTELYPNTEAYTMDDNPIFDWRQVSENSFFMILNFLIVTPQIQIVS